MNKKYLLVIGALTPSVIKAVNRIVADKKWADLELIVLVRSVDYTNRKIAKFKPNFKVQVTACSFSDQDLTRILEPIKQEIIGVSCRGDKRIQDLRKVVDYLPSSVYVASKEALTISTNKRLMREAFSKYDPTITPQHIKAKDASLKTIGLVERKLKYPVIVKPTNLASSLLIQACQNRQELQASLNKIFNLIYDIYEQEERFDQPEVIVEEYLEGDFYSIDAYPLGRGEVYFCPPVSYIPAKQIGIDDFFLYKRSIPTKLTSSEIEEAGEVTKRAIEAVGLEYTSAHVELVLTKNGWKVIELGPRVGRFRDRMYGLAYGIYHWQNDIKLHLGVKPIVNTKLLQYCATYTIHPYHEGKLIGIKGLDKVLSSPYLKWHRVFAEAGQQVAFAKHGGHSLAELVIACEDKNEFDKLVKTIEEHVYAEIDDS